MPLKSKVHIPSTGITWELQGNIPTGPLNKLWRAKILLDRATSGMPLNAGYTEPEERVSPLVKKAIREKTPSNLDIESKSRISANPDRFPVDAVTRYDTKYSYREKNKNQIIIINPGVSPYISLVIQGTPSSVDINPESTWASVKSVGRNNPFMMYLGGEDTISFEISWFSNRFDGDRADVINKCRLLESWTRSDGNRAAPPELLISWGKANLFKDDVFILTSAKYVISNFQNACLVGDRAVNLGLYPNCATQKLVFKKVTRVNNPHSRIISPEAVSKYITSDIT